MTAFLLSFLITTTVFASSAALPSEGAKPCVVDAILRPRVLVTEARLEFLRNDVKTNSVRRAIYEQDIKANADRWLHRAIVIPEPGGWFHDFCGPDGTLLELPADQRFEPAQASLSPSTGKGSLSPKILGARRFLEHVWLMMAVRDLALAGAVEQRRDYADQAAKILLKYADAYPHVLAEKTKFGFQQSSLNESVSLIPMAQGYDLIYHSGALTDEQKQHLERDFFWPEAQAISNAGLGGNWGSWHLSAVGVIGYATGHQRLIDFALNNFKSQITDQLGSDGLWPESVHTYHFYPLDGFLSLAEASGNCGKDLFHWQSPSGKSIEKMFEAPLGYMYPTLQLPAINDGWYDAWLPVDQYCVAYWHYHKPAFAWAIRRGDEVGRSGVTGDFYDQRYRLFLFGESIPEKTAAPVFTSTNFPGLGIAILRHGSNIPITREMFLTFHYGPFLGHGHYDKMGVTFFANGRPMAPELGTPGYGSRNMEFFSGVTAHNTIAAEDGNQPRTTDNHLIAFRDEPELKLAAAETSQLAPGTSWIRAILLAADYAVIWDDVRGNQKHTYNAFFHAFGDKLILSGTSASRPADPEKNGSFSYPFVTDVQTQQLTGPDAKANWLMPDGTGLNVWFMGDTNSVLFSGRCPASDGKTLPMIALRKRGEDCQFVSVLQPWKKRPVEMHIRADRSDLNYLRLTVTQPARTDVISFNLHQIEFDGAVGSPEEKKINVSFSGAGNN